MCTLGTKPNLLNHISQNKSTKLNRHTNSTKPALMKPARSQLVFFLFFGSKIRFLNFLGRQTASYSDYEDLLTKSYSSTHRTFNIECGLSSVKDNISSPITTVHVCVCVGACLHQCIHAIFHAQVCAYACTL